VTLTELGTDRVDLAARKYDLSRQEVLLQAVEIGLETIESDRSRRRA
jgi:hypothetical protein